MGTLRELIKGNQRQHHLNNQSKSQKDKKDKQLEIENSEKSCKSIIILINNY